jgi:Lon protease-like protein
MTRNDTLPAELPLFPLGGAILLPGEVLPLNVFEPRYLNMLDDVRSGCGHIGIIQTLPGADGEAPALRTIGGAGRLNGFRETEDGRYLITLEGVSRFRLVSELDARTPYRVARADYSGFPQDAEAEAAGFEPDRSRLVQLLRFWLEQEGVDADWESVAAAPLVHVINQLAMAAPFCSTDRQSLLEAADLPARFELMQSLIADRLADETGPRPG